MEPRKYPEADIRRKTDIYFMIGLVASLGLTYGAFSYTSRDEANTNMLVVEQVEEVEEMTDITRQDQPPPPPPPPPPQTIEVIEDDSEIEEADIEDTEIDKETEIEYQEQVEVVEVTKEPEIFMVVEDPPSFPGGEAAMMKYIADNLEYPPLARENNIQGRVVIQFVVDENGKITDAKVVKGIGWGCDEAALKVVNSMPRWKPGKQRNKAVRVRYILPIRFVLG